MQPNIHENVKLKTKTFRMNCDEFCKKLPKIELHAHLNGSLSEETLKNLGCLNESVSEYQKLTKLLKTNEKTLEECFALFKVAQNATNTKENVYFATKSVIEDFSKDNVIYLEIRTTPRNETNMLKREYIESVVKAIKENTSSSIIVKLILSIDRRHDLQTSQESVELFITMKNTYPDIIKGVDLSGNPQVGQFNKDLFQRVRQNGLLITLHCAEVRNDEEVEEMLKFRPERLGHATFLHPDFGGCNKNWNLYCQQKIPVEVCLTSNVICGTSKSYQSHHLAGWINSGMQFTLSTDDKGVFCTSLSEEFEHARNTFGLSYEELWKISYNSVDFCFANDLEKGILREKLQEWKVSHII